MRARHCLWYFMLGWSTYCIDSRQVIRIESTCRIFPLSAPIVLGVVSFFFVTIDFHNSFAFFFFSSSGCLFPAMTVNCDSTIIFPLGRSTMLRRHKSHWVERSTLIFQPSGSPLHLNNFLSRGSILPQDDPFLISRVEKKRIRGIPDQRNGMYALPWVRIGTCVLLVPWMWARAALITEQQPPDEHPGLMT